MEQCQRIRKTGCRRLSTHSPRAASGNRCGLISGNASLSEANRKLDLSPTSGSRNIHPPLSVSGAPATTCPNLVRAKGVQSLTASQGVTDWWAPVYDRHNRSAVAGDDGRSRVLRPDPRSSWHICRFCARRYFEIIHTTSAKFSFGTLSFRLALGHFSAY